MAVQQAGGNADPRIHALSVAINLEELDPTPFLQYLKTQVEYYSLDKGVDYPDLESEEIWVHECDSFTLAHQDGLCGGIARSHKATAGEDGGERQ